MTEARDVSTLLLRSLQQVDPRPLKGSELAVLVRTTLPDFKPDAFGCRTLRDFIRRFADDEIAESGRAGLDVIYNLRSTYAKSAAARTSEPINGPVGQLISNPRIWKTFASPDSIFRIFLTPEDTIRVLPPRVPPNPAWKEIPRISADTLLQIARDFVAGLPDQEKRDFLLPVLEKEKWWVPYFDVLQTLGLKSHWIDFRRRRIREEFSRIVANLEPPQHTHLRPPLDAISLSQKVASSGEPTKTNTQATMRRIASDVVQRMTESELRSLNLPLGYVVDVLTTR